MASKLYEPYVWLHSFSYYSSLYYCSVQKCFPLYNFLLSDTNLKANKIWACGNKTSLSRAVKHVPTWHRFWTDQLPFTLWPMTFNGNRNGQMGCSKPVSCGCLFERSWRDGWITSFRLYVRSSWCSFRLVQVCIYILKPDEEDTSYFAPLTRCSFRRISLRNKKIHMNPRNEFLLAMIWSEQFPFHPKAFDKNQVTPTNYFQHKIAKKLLLIDFTRQG